MKFEQVAQGGPYEKVTLKRRLKRGEEVRCIDIGEDGSKQREWAGTCMVH